MQAAKMSFLWEGGLGGPLRRSVNHEGHKVEPSFLQIEGAG